MSASLLSEPQSGSICGCENWMRSACWGELFNEEYAGKRYCVLHYPGNNKSALFEEALKEKLSQQNYNFRGVWFSDALSFSGFNFGTLVDFRQATFCEEADFGRAIFQAGANFKNSTFRRKALFRKASFEGDRKSDFSSTTFRSLADFSIVTFDSEVYFTLSTFLAQADFGKTVFKANAEFRRVSFEKVARFKRTIFMGNADFGRAVFLGKAAFKTATLGQTYFRKVTFGGRADFRRATFNEKTYFIGSTFSANAEFSYATFNGSTDFSDATFSAVTVFSSVTFVDYVKFAGVGQQPKQVFANSSSLDLQFARIEKPENVSFHSLFLRPHWFVNVDPRKFSFTNVDWDRRHIDEEIRSLQTKRATSPHRLLAIACRHLAVNAEESQRYGEASRFRYMAMDAKRRTEAHGMAVWKLSWWYWLASGYGERVMRAFLVFIGILVLSAFTYHYVGFKRWEPNLSNESEAEIAKSDDVGAPLSFGRALTYSAAVVSFQKPEPRPATTAAQTIVLLETILGPVQAALLALAIRRKFMR